MRWFTRYSSIILPLMLTACVTKGSNPDDPFEPINRKIYKFNSAFDATFLKPPARFYRSVIPPVVRAGINNAYNNVNMIPTVANDLLQGELTYALKDTWRFAVNSTLGIAGIMDVANKCSLPPHSNDLGLTFAKWGDKKSPYIVIPFLGPSTIRDGMGLLFNASILTPYFYIRNDTIIYSLLGLRYVDLRSQMLDTEKLMDNALDKYAFMRDAYFQHRNFLINGPEKPQNLGDMYVDEDAEDNGVLTPNEPANGIPSDFPLTTAQNDTHSAPSA